MKKQAQDLWYFKVHMESIVILRNELRYILYLKFSFRLVYLKSFSVQYCERKKIAKGARFILIFFNYIKEKNIKKCILINDTSKTHMLKGKIVAQISALINT